MREFGQVILEVTQACPHACLHCYNYWREQRAPVASPETLSRKQIQALVRKVKADTALKHVGISGGEPLLRRDLPGIVTDILEEDLGVLVISSLALLNSAVAARFPKETGFEFTLFSAEASLHDRIAGRPGAFSRTVAGALNAARRGCPMAVSVVFNRLNAEHVGDALRLGLALGANSFLLNRINFTRLTLSRAGELAPNQAQMKTALDQAEEFAEQYNLTVAISVPIPPCVVDLTPYRRLMFGWCARGEKDAYFTISHDGQLRPCNHTSRTIGDLKTRGFGELVGSRKALAFWKPVPRACNTCTYPDHHLCRGGCPAASDECYGTRTRWDPVVDLVGNGNGSPWARRPNPENRVPITAPAPSP